MLAGEMSRYTTFKFCLDPTVEQYELLARHAGASRFAFNQCLAMVKTALTQRKTDPDIDVPWTGFDLINAFNAWKKTEDAGRVFIVDTDGVTEAVVTGLAWRTEVCQQVFEEAAADLGKGSQIVVGLPIRQAQRQESRFSPFQEENRCGAVISVTQQAPQGPSGGDPRRRQQPPTRGYAAWHRPDRRA